MSHQTPPSPKGKAGASATVTPLKQLAPAAKKPRTGEKSEEKPQDKPQEEPQEKEKEKEKEDISWTQESWPLQVGTVASRGLQKAAVNRVASANVGIGVRFRVHRRCSFWRRGGGRRASKRERE